MKFIYNLKRKVKKLKQKILILYYAYQNPRLKLFPKLIIILTIAYALSPIDLIPDFIPILGYLDDLIIIPALITLSIKLIPKKIMIEATEKAINKPLKLKKNWFFGLLFILIWIFIGIKIITNLIKIFIHRY